MNLKNLVQSFVGLIAWPFMLIGAAWSHRKPGNKLGLFDRCPYDPEHGPCYYASGNRCTRPEDEECPK